MIKGSGTKPSNRINNSRVLANCDQSSRIDKHACNKGRGHKLVISQAGICKTRNKE